MKHHKTCMHCAFVRAFRTKYGKKSNDDPDAFDDMVRSAIKIAIAENIPHRLDERQQAKFIKDITAGPPSLEEMIKSLFTTQRPDEAKPSTNSPE